MKRVLTAVVLIPLVLLLVFRAPLWLFTSVVGIIALLAAHEYLNLVAAHGIEPFRKIVFLAILLWFLPYSSLTDPEIAAAGQQVTAVLPVALAMVLLAAALRRPSLSSGVPAAGASYLAFPYIASTLGALVILRAFSFGGYLVLILLLIVWSGDTAAYYVGRAIGKHKLAPRISPGKTWEGTLASLAASVAVGFALLWYAQPVHAFLARIRLAPGGTPHQLDFDEIWRALLVAAGINLAAQFGDLVESMIKRGAQVKDSGRLLPGHGGLLDRIDALLFAAPVLWYFAGTRFIYLQ